MASSSTDTPTNVVTSVALTWNSNADTARVSATDASNPIAMPSPATPRRS